MNSSENQNQALNMQNVSTKLWNIQYVNILLINMIINMASMILINILPLYAMSIGGNNLMLLVRLLTAMGFIKHFYLVFY